MSQYNNPFPRHELPSYKDLKINLYNKDKAFSAPCGGKGLKIKDQHDGDLVHHGSQSIPKHSAVTCENPGLCVSGLRDRSRAGGLMRRVDKPPCRGCSGVGRSSFSNTEEKSSPRTCRTRRDNQSIQRLGNRIVHDARKASVRYPGKILISVY